jgi:hypothetical protein
VTTGSTWDLNVAGCVALFTSGADGGDCATKASAAAGCEAAACSACPFVDGDNPLPRQQCFQSADVSGCAAYASAECDPADAGFGTCRASITSQDEFVAFASLFCNP